MTKIALFRESNSIRVMNSVNNFIRDKKVIDIKYRPFGMNIEFSRDGIPLKSVVYDSVMVIYEEDE